MTTDAPIITALLIEDDARLARLTADYLSRHALVVTILGDGESGLQEALRRAYDVILLDLMLPKLGGLDLLRRLREQRDTPIIILTARGEEADRVMGLELGADDYLGKPFSPRELLARIHALLRRAKGQAGPKQGRLSSGDLTLDPAQVAARLGDTRLDLTTYEFQLLYALVENRGRVLSRERLMDLVRGNAEEAFDRAIDVHISRLRKKLNDDPVRPRLIRTLRGIGYMFLDGEPD